MTARAAGSSSRLVIRALVKEGIGFSLLSFTQDTYHAFYFVTLKNWDQRKSADQQFSVIQQNLAKQLLGGHVAIWTKEQAGAAVCASACDNLPGSSPHF